MARPGREDPITDPTAVAGQTFAVDVRVGWLCRAARLVGEPSPVTLDSMARRLGTNPTRVHRLERGQLRDWDLIAGYEKQLALTAGSLAAPIRIALRYLPDRRRERDLPDPQADVRTTSVLTERLLSAVTAGEPGTGIDWLRWASILGQSNAVGLPESIAVELIDGLTGELARSVGPAFPTRYEALSHLREGPYGYLLLEVARKRVGDPDVQILLDMMSALTESRAHGVAQWCADLLCDTRGPVVNGALVGLDNLIGLDPTKRVIEPILPGLVAAYRDAPEDSAWRGRLSGLLRQAPPDLLARQRTRLGGLLTVSARPGTGRARRPTTWPACEDLAWRFSTERGLREQPLLARLLYDAAFSPFEYISVPSFHLLGALPALRRWTADAVAEIVESVPSAIQGAGAARRLAGARLGYFPKHCEPWWASPDPRMLAAVMLLAGQAGKPPPPAAVRRLLAVDPTSPEVLNACAMTVGVDAIGAYLGATELPAELVGPARWFRREGGLVVDDAGDPPFTSREN